MAIPLEITREPGQGAIWFDHIPDGRAEGRGRMDPDLVEFSAQRMEAGLGGGDTALLMGGPQFNGFITPEYLGADAEIVAYRRRGGGARNVMY